MMSEYNRYILANQYMRNIPYWLNIRSILYQYGCATRAVFGAKHCSFQVVSLTRRQDRSIVDVEKMHLSDELLAI